MKYVELGDIVGLHLKRVSIDYGWGDNRVVLWAPPEWLSLSLMGLEIERVDGQITNIVGSSVTRAKLTLRSNNIASYEICTKYGCVVFYFLGNNDTVWSDLIYEQN